MRTADLLGAMLDFWTARAEGIPAAELELRAVGTLCVRNIATTYTKVPLTLVLDYSTNWALTGPLVEKHTINVDACFGFRDEFAGYAAIIPCEDSEPSYAPNPLIAICRAVVRAAFGDEVEDLPCA